MVRNHPWIDTVRTSIYVVGGVPVLSHSRGDKSKVCSPFGYNFFFYLCVRLYKDSYNNSRYFLCIPLILVFST